MAKIEHKDSPVGEDSSHPLGYAQSSDPGAVGAYRPWVDTTTTPYVLKVRNAADTGWEVVGFVNTPSTSNGQSLQAKSLTELTTIAASPTTDTAIQMPAGSIVLAVSVRVTVAVTCTTDFTVGDSGSAARFSTAAVSKAANSTDKGTKAGAYYNASALSVRITPDTTPSDNTGRVRVTVFYLESTPPTS